MQQEDLISLHEDYLQSIITKLFLDDSQQEIKKLIENVFDVILLFQTNANVLHSNIRTFQQRTASQLEPTLHKLNLAQSSEYQKILQILQQYNLLMTAYKKIMRDLKIFPLGN